LRNPAAPFAACLAMLCACIAAAQAPALRVQDAWIRATPGADVAAAYLTLHNGGATPVVIIGVRSPLAGRAMLHETRLASGQSTMRPRERLSVAPGATVRLAPGGLHVMLQSLAHPLTAGDDVPVILLLAGGGTLAVTARVRPLSAG
jgi:periplasmic copper chaperone A